MQRHHITALAIVLGVMSNGCTTTTRPPISSPVPSIPDTALTEPSAITYLRFNPGIYRYQFSQTAEIRGDGTSDTIPTSIATRAVVEVEVTLQGDSSFSVIISFDSITIDTQGSIPVQRPRQHVVLDSIIHGVFSRAGNRIEIRLADSLCAYSQFIIAAREILLPELGFETPTSARRNSADTTSQYSCRAGATITMTTVRELRDSRRSPGEMEMQQHTELYGTGLLRRDSITVSGSISTRGKILFGVGNRLPSLIETESEGRITVRLGSTMTNFRQRSRQEVQLLPTDW